MEALTAAPGAKEVLAEALGVAFGFRVGLAGLIDGGVGQAEDDPADHPQHSRRPGRAHPAEVFLQRHVQAVMEPAFDHPVAALEPQQPFGLQLLDRVTADQVNGLFTPFALTKDPRA